MTEFRLELDDSGIKALLKSEGVRREIQRRVDNVAAAAGEGMKSQTYTGRDRVRGMVWTSTPAARRAEAERRSLTRAMDAARE